MIAVTVRKKKRRALNICVREREEGRGLATPTRLISR
jgi:hypothetical protein